jgi:hypothetical protein
VSAKQRFPRGVQGRTVLTWKALDLMCHLSSRIGMEMTKKYLTSCLKKFFDGFDVAFGAGHHSEPSGPVPQ